MKLLVIGGSSGLGLAIAERYQADQLSRSNGYSVPERIQDIIDQSFNYDVIVNCLPDSNQNKLLFPMFDAHDERSLATYFITIGSMSCRFNPIGHSKRDLFDWSETLITRASTSKHTLINPAYLWNSKNQGHLEEISQEEMLTVIDFLIQFGYNSTISLLEIKGPHRNVNR